MLPSATSEFGSRRAADLRLRLDTSGAYSTEEANARWQMQ